MLENLKTIKIEKYWPFALLWIGFGIIFYPVLESLVHTWETSEEYSHGFLIIPISLFIVWQKRHQIAATRISPSLLGLIWVIGSLLIYLLSQYAGVVTLASMSLVSSIFGIVWYLYGYTVLKILLFPIGYLLFMIPVPSQIYSAMTIPLQLIVSKISVGFAHLLQLPVFREGNVIHLPEQTLQVVEACSGLRSMISLMALSSIYSYMTLNSNWLRGLLFISGIPVAILVNIVRVMIMIFSFHFFKYNLTEGTIHTLFGVVIFFLALVIIASFEKGLSIWDK